MRNSLFMCDNTQIRRKEKNEASDGSCEQIIDYVISWTVRMAEEGITSNPILHSYSRRILCNILNITESPQVIFNCVKTWKQEYKIDIWVETEINNNGRIEHHCILIEDKRFDKVRPESSGKLQIEEYKEKLDNWYKKNGTEEWIKHYVLITAMNSKDAIKTYSCVEKFGFKILTLEGLVFGEKNRCTTKDHPQYTNNYLFDTFWLENW